MNAKLVSKITEVMFTVDFESSTDRKGLLDYLKDLKDMKTCELTLYEKPIKDDGFHINELFYECDSNLSSLENMEMWAEQINNQRNNVKAYISESDSLIIFSDNTEPNLMWATPKENTQFTYTHGKNKPPIIDEDLPF